MTQPDLDKIRIDRFGWHDKEANSLVVEGKPDYEEISLTRDGVRVTKRGERPH